MTTSEDTLFHVDPPEPVRHWLIVGRDEPYIEKHGDDPDDPARTYAIECSDSKRCPGFIECLEDHTGAPDYDDTGDDEAVIHGVDHTYHYGYGWTVPYPGCVVQGVAFWGDDHLHIAKERGLGRHELETEWDDEYCTLTPVDTKPTGSETATQRAAAESARHRTKLMRGSLLSCSCGHEGYPTEDTSHVAEAVARAAREGMAETVQEADAPEEALRRVRDDVLALAERLSHGNLLRADYSDGLKDAAEQIRRAITTHATPDAPASEATETKG